MTHAGDPTLRSRSTLVSKRMTRSSLRLSVPASPRLPTIMEDVMAPTIVDMVVELEASHSPIVTHTIEASPRLHTIEAVTVELADVTIDAAIDAAMFEPTIASGFYSPPLVWLTP